MGTTNKKKKLEYCFVESFIKCYQLKQTAQANKTQPLWAVQASGSNQSTYADCEIVYDNRVVKIEAKRLQDGHNNSGSFYNLIGELIGVINKPSLLRTKGVTVEDVVIGILIPENSKSTFDELWNDNIKPNGIKYCNAFNIKHLITFDETSKNIQFFSFDEEKDEWK